jgi:hypothetical protein
MSDIERPAKKSKTAAPRRDIRVVRPLPIDPNLPAWRQVRLQLWSARRALRVLRALRRGDPSIPADRIVALQLKAIALAVRIQALAVRCPPPSRSATATSDSPLPTREICRRSEIRRRPETRTGPPSRNDNGPLLHRGPKPAHSADVVSNDSSTIDRTGPPGKRADSARSSTSSKSPRSAPSTPSLGRAPRGAPPGKSPRGNEG